jgi:hypothetical protein
MPEPRASQVRARARRLGLLLRKERGGDGYMLVDGELGAAVFGTESGVWFTATLDQVVEHLDQLEGLHTEEGRG